MGPRSKWTNTNLWMGQMAKHEEAERKKQHKHTTSLTWVDDEARRLPWGTHCGVAHNSSPRKRLTQFSRAIITLNWCQANVALSLGRIYFGIPATNEMVYMILVKDHLRTIERNYIYIYIYMLQYIYCRKETLKVNKNPWVWSPGRTHQEEGGCLGHDINAGRALSLSILKFRRF